MDELARRYRRQLRKIETITKETDRLADTLNDFLRYAGRIELHLARQDLEEAQVNIAPLTPEQKRELEALSRDIARLWSCPETSPSLKKQLLRTAIREIAVTHDHQRLEFTIHWEGDVCTCLTVKKRKTPVGSGPGETVSQSPQDLPASPRAR